MQPENLFSLWKNRAGIFILTILVFLLSACANLETNLPLDEFLNHLESEGVPVEPTRQPTRAATQNAPELPRSLPENYPTLSTPVQTTPTQKATSSATPTITASVMPTTSSDLLYLTQDKLMRWDHVTQFSTLLVDRVAAFSALIEPFSAYQFPTHSEAAVKKIPRLIALLRSREITANGEAMFDLDILDLDTKQIINLHEKIARIEAINFTIQGDRLVYIERGSEDRILMTKTIAGSSPQIVAVCNKEGINTCSEALWSPDGRSLAWSDAKGIWLIDDRSSLVKQIQTDRIMVLDPKNQESEVKVSYEIISWSPNNRFLLVKIIPSAQGVQWYSILDTRMSRLVDIPESAEFSTQAAKISWTFEGHLFIAKSSNPENEQPPLIQVWRIIPTNNSLLVPGKRIILGENSSEAVNDLLVENSLCPIWFQQLDAFTFRMALLSLQGDSQASLNQLDFEKNNLDQLLPIPADTEKILWSPDRNGALIFGKHNQIIFASFLENELFDLIPIVGEDANSFQWLPAAER